LFIARYAFTGFTDESTVTSSRAGERKADAVLFVTHFVGGAVVVSPTVTLFTDTCLLVACFGGAADGIETAIEFICI
jgi:hypothetical protein